MSAVPAVPASPTIAAAAPAARPSTGTAARVLWLAAVALMAWHFCNYFGYAIAAIRYPFELDYGEGIVWQQAMLIPGPHMYGDITRYPFIVFHYPPLYHLVVRGLALLVSNTLLVGRSVSVASTLVIATLAAGLSSRASCDDTGRSAARAGAAVAGLSVFCYWPVVVWSPLFRVDMLATALSLLGVWCAVRSVQHPRLLYCALIAFVLAVYTKQSCLAAPLATVPIMFLTNRTRTLKACALGFLLALAALAILMWATHGGFLLHIILYNLNRYDLGSVFAALRVQSPQIIFLLLAVAGLCVGWRSLAAKASFTSVAAFAQQLRDSPGSLTRAVLMLYFVTSTMTLATLGKSGGAMNYFIEWMCVLSPWIGILTAVVLQASLGAGTGQSPRSQSVALLVVPIMLIYQVALLPSSAAMAYRLNDSRRSHELGELLARVEQARRPVLSDDMVLLMQAGKTVPWEPAIFAELAATGRWDQHRITDLLTQHHFAFVITSGHPGMPLYDSRYNPPVSQAIETAYPYATPCAGRIVHFATTPAAAAMTQACSAGQGSG